MPTNEHNNDFLFAGLSEEDPQELKDLSEEDDIEDTMSLDEFKKATDQRRTRN